MSNWLNISSRFFWNSKFKYYYMGTDSRMWQYGSQHQQQYDNLQNKTLICVITLLIVVL